TRPALTCPELPRRLFRPATTTTAAPIPPLLTYLFDTFHPSANSHKGYPLCRAVIQANTLLIAYLLAHGADPSIKDDLAIRIAISMKRDLSILRLLVEQDKGEVETGAKTKGKRVRDGDRVAVRSEWVELALQSGNRDIVNYLVHEKDCMPTLSSIMRMDKSKKTKIASKVTTKRPKPTAKRRRISSPTHQ
ncbi:hypothetical protein P7C73_g2952, partial [Tremellales sp. Uapishka_1]